MILHSCNMIMRVQLLIWWFFLFYLAVSVSQCMDTPGLPGREPENTRSNGESRSWTIDRWFCFHVSICWKWLSTSCAIIGDIRGWHIINAYVIKFSIAWSSSVLSCSIWTKHTVTLQYSCLHIPTNQEKNSICYRHKTPDKHLFHLLVFLWTSL